MIEKYRKTELEFPKNLPTVFTLTRNTAPPPLPLLGATPHAVAAAVMPPSAPLGKDPKVGPSSDGDGSVAFLRVATSPRLPSTRTSMFAKHDLFLTTSSLRPPPLLRSRILVEPLLALPLDAVGNGRLEGKNDGAAGWRW
jgi:hypothetical protein